MSFFFFPSRRRHTRCALVTGVQTCALPILRAWLSQWSVEDSNADGVRCAAAISAPLLAIENTADDAVPQPHARRIFDAASSPDKTFKIMKGATHYYAGQPEHLREEIGRAHV